MRKGLSSRRLLAAASAALLLVVGLVPTASAIASTGSVSGNVTVAPDSAGSSLVGWTVIVSSDSVSPSPVPLNPDGSYTVTGLEDGSYTLQFAPGADAIDLSLAGEYYNDVYYPAESTPVVVTGGQAVTGINAELSTVRHFTSTPSPTITSLSLIAGATLGSRTGVWAPGAPTLSHQWKRNGIAIPGATASSYVLSVADRGTTITLTVTASSTGYTTTAKTSLGVYVPRVFTKTPTPSITGTAKKGFTLTAHPGTWSPAPTLSYRWLRNGVAIANATKATYKLTSSDKGKKISVRVTATRSGFTTVAKISAAKVIAK